MLYLFYNLFRLLYSEYELFNEINSGIVLPFSSIECLELDMIDWWNGYVGVSNERSER